MTGNPKRSTLNNQLLARFPVTLSAADLLACAPHAEEAQRAYDEELQRMAERGESGTGAAVAVPVRACPERAEGALSSHQKRRSP